MCGTGLQGAVCVGNGTASIVVKMSLDIAANHTPQGADEVIDLSWAGASDSVGDTNAVNTDLVDGAVNREKIDEI